MSDPFRGPAPDKDEQLDKRDKTDAPKDLPGLNIDDIKGGRGGRESHGADERMSNSGEGGNSERGNSERGNAERGNAERANAERNANAERLNAERNANAERLNAERNANAEKSLGKLDLSFTAGRGIGGDRSHLQLRKSEFSPTAIDRPISQYKPLINEFLQNTNVEKEHKRLNEAELRELYRSREALSNATNMQDALSDALHLARLYQHMRYIEEAKKAINLSLGIDPDNQHGTQLFRELERMHSAEIGSAAPPQIADETPLTKSNLRKRILSLTGGKVIVIGDLLIDELLEGKPERISREAPVLILEHVDTELIPGGAANTANNIAALGGICHAIGVCGNDEYANKLEKLFDDAHISHDLVRDPSRPTTVKTRILSKSHSFKQQLLRLDRISHDPIDVATQQQLVSNIRNVAGDYKAIVLSDYRAGVMTDELIRACRAVAAEANLLLIVDAQDDFVRFQNVSLMTPNQPDTEKAVGYAIDSKETLKRAGQDLMQITGSQAVLITRGGEGMVLFQQGEPMVELPAFNKSEVFDVTGAGDTVVATMALALVSGSSYVEAMALGNLAAGIVVKKPGTAVTSQKEMLENLDLLKIEE